MYKDTTDDFDLQTGVMIRALDTHSDVVTALIWLPDGSGFISGGLDRKIFLWVSVADTMDLVHNPDNFVQDADGKQRDSWGRTPIRVTDLAITPDFTRLVAIGMYDAPAPPASTSPPDTGTPPVGGAIPVHGQRHHTEHRAFVYDLATKQAIQYVLAFDVTILLSHTDDGFAR